MIKTCVPRESWHEWKKKKGLKSSFQNETLFMHSHSMSATKAFLSLNQHCRSQLATLIDLPLDDLSANDIVRLRNKPHPVFFTKLTRAWNLRWKCSPWCIIFNQWCTLKIRALNQMKGSHDFWPKVKLNVRSISEAHRMSVCLHPAHCCFDLFAVDNKWHLCKQPWA